ncbi:MAG TPA: hypothetical protein VHU80_03990 [Polyangiaceae bacterium]|jgi:hypothetical protein|nr:hypothetical protein [Polyangiaceae bacterium]
MLEESEWVRLPGLFRWDEICEVFATEAMPDREWHFLVHAASGSSAAERLYVVHAAREAATKLAAERLPRVIR